MASWDCPNCTTRTQFNSLGAVFEGSYGVPPDEKLSFAQCTNCNYILTAFFQRTDPNRILRTWPGPGDVVGLTDAIPEPIRRDLEEAVRVHGVAAHKAAAAMCRRALQGAALDLGAPKKRLVDQIDALFEAGKITEGLRDLAHKVRFFGNSGAHPGDDGLDDVTELESANALDFARSFMRYVYELPAQVAALTARASASEAERL